ncbi:hypothetical protein V6Z11_A07G217100 [Gossypium hirsutum]
MIYERKAPFSLLKSTSATERRIPMADHRAFEEGYRSVRHVERGEQG